MKTNNWWILLIVALVSSGYFESLPAENQDDGGWSNLNNLSSPRIGHTATLLPNGKVLIVGGFNGAEELTSAELFDPKENAFTPTGALNSARTSHSATLLPNGQVLVAGGQCHGSTVNSAELYNPKTGVWTQTAHLHFARVYHTATLLANGQVLVVGGAHMASPPVYAQGAPPGSALDVAEIYDPTSGKWAITDEMHTARYAHTATLLKNGKVLVTGGMGANGMGSAVASAELYDPAAKTWTETTPLPCEMFEHTATLLRDGQVLITGGQVQGNLLSRADLYNPSKAIWTTAASLPVILNGQTATRLPDGQVIVVGGANNSGVLTNVEVYDPSTQSWKKLLGLNKGRALHTTTLFPNGQILVTGGCYALGLPDYASDSVELYTPGGEGSKRAPASVLPAPAPPSSPGVKDSTPQLPPLKDFD